MPPSRRHVRGAVRAGEGGHAGRRELPGAGVQRGGRHAPLHALGPRGLAHRRRRQRLRRPGLLVGTPAAGARPPGGAGRRPGRGGPRDVVRHPDRARGRARRGDRRPHAGGEGAAGQLGHRGDDVGDPAGPGLHRPRRRGEVRRLLPRPRRRAARLRRLRAGDLRGPGHPRRTGVVHRPDPGAALQRPVRRRGGLRRARRPDRVPDHRGRPRQHGRGPAGARLQRVPRRDLPRGTARCSSATR